MENRYQPSGWALSIYGVFNVLGLILSYAYVIKFFTSLSGISLLALIFVNLLIAIGFLAFLCGIYLLKNNDAVHKFALPVSVVILLSFPTGTLAGALYLWQRNQNT
ncbi:hypothetical protein [uncultured Paraglaciecola sp.]|uniref:hypothetical protein n=1 Tax=uncultured Paraglaciecola sp. TaxID=1765024 RepID=UPI0025F0642C|nr:hypothetical protein [uncultured Paraglaciecola sp.]